MSVAELNTVNMAEVLINAYELGDMVNRSFEVSDYLYWKQRVELNPSIQACVRKLDAKKGAIRGNGAFWAFSSELS